MFRIVLIALLCAGFVESQSSCAGRCDDYADQSYTCQCNSLCDTYGDCCPDYVPTCLPSETCVGRCGEALDLSKPCHCNSGCENYNDCCVDYASVCTGSTGSCVGKCDSPLDSSQSCQCNSACLTYNDCCADYSTVCNAPSGGCSTQTISSTELLDISLELFDLDINKPGPDDVIFSKQAQTSDSSTQDNSPNNFFTYVDETLFTKPTYNALINLLDNYQNIEGIDEVIPDQELQENQQFLEQFLATSIGKRLYEFLDGKGLAGCADEEAFKDNLHKMWFEMYSRQNNAMDTSGFEHVFVGEIKTNIVSGFHNWVQFYRQEQSQRLNYYGYTGSSEPNLFGVHFEWDGYMKGLSGVSLGSSPEYDFAVFTLCHMAKANSVCKVSLRDDDGSSVTRNVQTYTWSKTSPGGNLKYVASAYFII